MIHSRHMLSTLLLKKTFKTKYKSKKSKSDSIVIHFKYWKKGDIFHLKSFGKELISSAELLPDKFLYDKRLKRNWLNKFYLCILFPLEIRNDNQTSKWEKIENRIVAIDPGVRTFGTTYFLQRLSEWESLILEKYIDCAMSWTKWSQKEIKHRTRYRIKHSVMRIRKKIINLVDELHKKRSFGL